MDEQKDMKAEKKSCCCCGMVLGVLIIALAWLNIPWKTVALTVLGAAVIVKEVIGCCCKGKFCKIG